jgi:hypothetical protein
MNSYLKSKNAFNHIFECNLLISCISLVVLNELVNSNHSSHVNLATKTEGLYSKQFSNQTLFEQ